MSANMNFCPFCGKARPANTGLCPNCKAPSIYAVLAGPPQGSPGAAGMGALPGAPVSQQADPIEFFGEDVPTLLYDEQKKSYFVNPDKVNTKFEWLTGQLNGAFPFVLAANAQAKFRVPINPEVGFSGDTEVGAFMLTSSARLAVRIFVPLLDKFLSNTLIQTNLLFATAQMQALLAQTIYSLPSYDWAVDVKEMGGVPNTVSPVFFARRFLDNGGKKIEAARRAAGMGRFMHPFVLGPDSAYDNTANAPISPTPDVLIPSGHTVTCTYSVPSDMFFDAFWIFDDSSTSLGANTEINDLFVTRIAEGSSGRSLITVPGGSNGLSLRSFIAAPTVAVAGMPSGGANTATGGVRAASFQSPGGCWSHLFSPGTDVQITYVNTDAGTVTLRTAISGIAVYADLAPAEACS